MLKLVIYSDDSIRTFYLAVQFYLQSGGKPVKFDFKGSDMIVLPYFLHKKREDFEIFIDKSLMHRIWHN